LGPLSPAFLSFPPRPVPSFPVQAHPSPSFLFLSLSFPLSPPLGAYPPNYIPVIVGVCVGVPLGLLFIFGMWWFYRRLKLKALTKDCTYFFFFPVKFV
jgi:hypothetical protein